MRYLIILFLLMPSLCIAGQVEYDREIITFNDKYSGKAFPYHGLSFKKETDLKPGTVIYASVFYQEWVEGDVMKDIFPATMEGVTFYNCNLDNVYISPGNTVIGGQHRKIQVQNDWDDWILEDNLKPKKPMNKEEREKKNLSIKPNDIPKDKWTKEERKQFEELLNAEDIIAVPIS